MKKGYNMTRIEMMRRKINECLSENLMTNVTFEITSEVYSDREEFTVVFAMGQYRATLLVSCVGTNTWVYHSYSGHCACSGSKYYRSIISVFRQMVNDIDDYKEMWEVVAETEEATKIEDLEETEEVEEIEEIEEIEETTRATIKIPYVDADYSNFMKVPKNSIYGMFGNMSLPCRVCTHFCTRCDNDNYTMEYCCRKNKENEKKAIKNPEWHHVSLNTLTNLDFYMLETKRQKYMTIYKLARNTIKSMYKCKSITQYRSLTNRLITYVHSAYRHDRCTIALVQYVRAKIADVNVNCNVQSSVDAEEYGYHESRRYN